MAPHATSETEAPMTDEAGLEIVQKLIRVTDLFTPSAVRAGATHRVFSSLAGGMTLPALAEQAHLDLSFLRIIVDFYVECGLVAATDDEDRFELTATGTALAQAEPALSMRGMFGQTARSMIAMDHTLKTGEISTRGLCGTDFWTALSAADTDAEAIERELGAGVADYDSDLVRDLVDWTGVTSIADIGGGRGDLLLKLLDAVPGAEGTVLEYGHMVDVAARHLARSRQGTRARVTRGSYLEPLDVRADVLVYSGILADWPRADALTILRHGREAAQAAAGRVVLAEITLRGATARERLYYRSIIADPARETDVLVDYARTAGFRGVSVLGGSPRRSVIELVP